MADEMKYLVLIQARCGSTRLPNKVLKNISGKPDLQWVIERVKRSRLIDEVMVITSIEVVTTDVCDTHHCRLSVV